jgi:signal transduction histidine kinase
MNILVVDDEAVMVESIRIGLENRGHCIIETCSAQQALNKLSSGEYGIDLVVTDYLMPAMNGLDLLAAIRRSYPTLPVILMTAYAQTSLVIEALRNRCDSFIEKPFNLDQLVAEIERIELQLLQNTKSSDLHQLLPRLVHQINNPLMAIHGFAELIRLNGSNGALLQRYAEKILAAVEQIGRINKDIMNVGLTEEGEFKPVEIDVLLDGCLEMFKGLFILKDIQVERRIPVHGQRVLGNQFGLEQVFKNLVLNAVDAMDGLIDKTMTITITPPMNMAFVEVTIEDTGCGIREEFMSRIFEPYFTDKRNGTGLGLEIIKNIVEKHGGKALVESQVGAGSKFIVRLPAFQMNESKGAWPSGDDKTVDHEGTTEKNC